MDNAREIVAQAVGDQRHPDLPDRVHDIIERHRQTLLDLARALLAANRAEEEVVQIIHKASESFSIKLAAETQGLQS